jgi:hypothetical protein
MTVLSDVHHVFSQIFIKVSKELATSTLKENMDIAGSSETLVPIYQKTRRQNPDDSNL